MRITRLRIRNFRSIEDISMNIGPITILCGPNSCGKSNVMRALEYCFREDIDRDSIYQNMIAPKRDQQGGPHLSIWIELWFTDCSREVLALAGAGQGQEIKYQFRAYRGGKVTRALDSNALDVAGSRALCKSFLPVYMPTIRDPSSGGIEPFQQLFADVLRRSRGEMTMAAAADKARKILKAKATPLLKEHQALAGSFMNARAFDVNPDNINLDHLYKQVRISVELEDGKVRPLEAFGTGHQSLFIIHLYRQLGMSTPGHTLYLLEEPDNHLHPTTISGMAADLVKLAQTAQVIISTHSPMLVNLLGLENAHPLFADKKRGTSSRPISLGGYTEGALRHLLLQYGVRATEPLFARRIVLVEGPTDAHVLTRLIELRSGRSPEKMDLLFVVAGGKDGVVKLAELLTAMGTDWRAVLDWDAAFSVEMPYTVPSMREAQKATVISAIDTLKNALDDGNKRGKNAVKNLVAIRQELENGRRSPAAYDGSVLERIAKVVRKLPASEISQLRESIRRRHGATYRPLTKQLNTWLWSGSIEDVMLFGLQRLDTLEALLIETGKLPAPLQPNVRQKQLRAIMHNSGQDIDLLSRMVERFESKGLFARTEINQATGFLMEGLF